MSTSIGVCQGNDHADFVFGGRSNSNGLSFRFASGLHAGQSLAQQQLDFIQRLYLKQARPGEFFEQIHLGATGVTSPNAAESATKSTAKPESLIHDTQNHLRELLQAWVSDHDLKLKIVNHRELSIQNRKTFLQEHQLYPGSLALKEFDLTEAYTLWSMAFPGTPDSFDASAYKTFKTLGYKKIDNLELPSYLEDYKQELSWKFNAKKYTDYDSENERHYLITLAGDPDATRYELLACQESLKKMLERETVSKSLLDENTRAANDPVTETELKVSVAGERPPANFTASPKNRPVIAMPKVQNATASLAVDMDMDRTAEIPADLTDELTEEIDETVAAELTAEITSEITSEWTEGLDLDSTAELTGTAELDATSSCALPNIDEEPQPQSDNSKIAEVGPLAESALTITISSKKDSGSADNGWREPNAKRFKSIDAWSFRAVVMVALLAGYFVYQSWLA